MNTKQLSDFLHSLSYEDLTENAVCQAKMCIEDLLSAAFAGSVCPQGGIWRQYISSLPQRCEAVVWDSSLRKLSCEQAAALNAAYAHAIDMDDVHNSSITHMGAVTIPAALAVGQVCRSSGKEVITAIAAGYEAGARIGEAINPGAYHYWHTTGVVGSFASAVAAGKLMGLDSGQFLNAIGSAGTQSAGLWQFIVDGAMSKTLHTANATLSGIRSAKLAALGFTAAQDILCGSRGFLSAITADNHPEVLTAGLGSDLMRIETNSFKPYACCRHTHAAVYCVDLLQDRHRIDPERIIRITDYTYQVAKDNVDVSAPATPYGYKFSVQYCIAAEFLYADLSDAAFSSERTDSDAARRLMDKITVLVDPELENLYQDDHDKWPHCLEVELDDGTMLKQEVIYPFGDFNNPFTWDDIHSKFRRLTDGILSADMVSWFVDRLPELEALEDINMLFPG